MKKIKITLGKVMLLIFLLSISLVAFWMLYFFEQTITQWPYLKNGLFYFGFFSSLAVFGIILTFYLSQTIKSLRESYLRLYFVIAIFLGLCYALFTGLKENSWLTFFANCAYSGLVIVGMPLIAKAIQKVGKKK